MKRILIIAHKKKTVKGLYGMARYATTAAACGRQVPWIKLGTKQGCRQLEGLIR